jgi:hypothetical protein
MWEGLIPGVSLVVLRYLLGGEHLFLGFPCIICCGITVTRGLRVLRKQLFLRLLLTTCRASEYTLDLESCLGTLRQS